MHKKTWIQVGIFYAGLSILALLAFLLMDRTAMIIAVGVKRTDFLLLFRNIILGAAFLAGTVFFVLTFLKTRTNKTKHSGSFKPHVYDLDKQIDPLKIYTDLAHFQSTLPRLKDHFVQAGKQLDSIERKQVKIADILKRNNIETLSEVLNTMENAEQSLCKNIVKIINRASLWEPEEANNLNKADVYNEHQEYIVKKLSQNDEILDLTDKLLSETVSYMNEKTPDQDDVYGLEAMTEAIKSLREMNSR